MNESTEAKQKIMLVDDNITNLTVGKHALSESYDVFTIPSGQKLLKVLEKTLPDLILLDIDMPDMNGYDIIKIIKKDENMAKIPVIFLTAQSDATSELEGLSLGAIDYIVKPFSPPLLLKRLETHLLIEHQKTQLKNFNDNLQSMVEAKTRTVYELQNAILETMAELVECRDDITGGHIERTKNHLSIMVNEMIKHEKYKIEMDKWGDIELVVQSAQLHDVGKISISDAVLNKPGKLTDEEFVEMKKHTSFGVEIIQKIEQKSSEKEFLHHAKIFAGTHHEKWNGFGYPYGLKETGIPLQGRAMAIADVYDALVSERPYKKGFPHEKAVDIIVEGRGTQFDPDLVDLFLEIHEKFHEVDLEYKEELKRHSEALENYVKPTGLPDWLLPFQGQQEGA
ncbi:two-component system response regulator [Clostridia bacterium]|nr:two-component system response regulator [Clostridia bacterium]